jgi:hypothetical protein
MKTLTRNYVDNKYKMTLTDEQWLTVLSQLEDEEEDEISEESLEQGLTTCDEILDEVITNLDSYVEDIRYFERLAPEGWAKEQLESLEADLEPQE